MKSNKTKLIFISIEGIIYITFLMIDLWAEEYYKLSNGLKYVSILICFFYMLFGVNSKEKNEEFKAVRLAIIFTFLADTCLVLLHWNIQGVVAFLCVQLCYYYKQNRKTGRKGGIPALIWVLLLVTLFVLQVPVDVLLCVTSLYFTMLVYNVMTSLFQRENVLFTIGMVLFLCCDINVGLYNLSSYLTIAPSLYEIIDRVSCVAIWAFYLPSQVLICLSVNRNFGNIS